MEIKINDFCDFVDKVINNNRKLNNNCRDGYIKLFDRSEMLYRGHSNKDYELRPNIGRNSSILKQERNLIEMAKLKLPKIFNNILDPIELLALLQHYGIYTRLLDVTENPLVALYFACSSKQEKDGEVIAFENDYSSVESAPVMKAIAASYKFFKRGIYDVPLIQFYKKANEQGYFLENCESCNDDQVGAEWIENVCSYTLIVNAPINILRQRMQLGKYILFPNDIVINPIGEKIFTDNISPLPKDKAIRYIIPAKIKSQMLKDLKALGICRELLFLDSPDIVCQEILNELR